MESAQRYFEAFQVADLRAALSQRGLSHEGMRSELVSRLAEHDVVMSLGLLPVPEARPFPSQEVQVNPQPLTVDHGPSVLQGQPSGRHLGVRARRPQPQPRTPPEVALPRTGQPCTPPEVAQNSQPSSPQAVNQAGRIIELADSDEETSRRRGIPHGAARPGALNVNAVAKARAQLRKASHAAVAAHALHRRLVVREAELEQALEVTESELEETDCKLLELQGLQLRFQASGASQADCQQLEKQAKDLLSMGLPTGSSVSSVLDIENDEPLQATTDGVLQEQSEPHVDKEDPVQSEAHKSNQQNGETAAEEQQSKEKGSPDAAADLPTQNSNDVVENNAKKRRLENDPCGTGAGGDEERHVVDDRECQLDAEGVDGGVDGSAGQGEAGPEGKASGDKPGADPSHSMSVGEDEREQPSAEAS
eukprot:TRINITY_DN70300_c0_g1_i1.p1 TRINITY_DN70300_c0_g1~~TRINITY_DN70300_c0_g1_i1.p1  ORF type:complete len:430 (+),score=105.69 TRINITY_DN70300_c0_g1_i1:29-1291(+)